MKPSTITEAASIQISLTRASAGATPNLLLVECGALLIPCVYTYKQVGIRFRELLPGLIALAPWLTQTVKTLLAVR